MIWRRDAEPLPDPRIGLESAVALFGDGVFSTVRVDRGAPWLVDRHVDRMLASAATLRLLAPPRASIERAIAAACGDADPARVYRLRVMLVPTDAAGLATVVYTALSEHHDAVRPVRLAVSSDRHPRLGAGKTLSWQWSRAALREAPSLGADDVILTDGSCLVETATGALAVHLEGRWGLVECPGAAPLPSTTVAALRALGALSDTHRVPTGRTGQIAAAMVLSAIRIATPVSHLDGRPLDAATEAAEHLRELLAHHCGQARPSRVTGLP